MLSAFLLRPDFPKRPTYLGALSGGQQQRVAIALMERSVFLFDEPITIM